MSFSQYLKDTQAELRHVAWPTQTQTILYTIFVVLFSIVISLYLGLFDFLFTSSLTRYVENAEPAPLAAPAEVVPTFSTSTPAN